MVINEKIKSERVKKGLSAKQLANTLDVTVSNVYDWERGKSKPNASYIKRLAETFGISPYDIIGTPYSIETLSEFTKIPSKELTFEQKIYVLIGSERARVETQGIDEFQDFLQDAEQQRINELFSFGGENLLEVYQTLNTSGKLAIINSTLATLETPSFVADSEQATASRKKLNRVKSFLSKGDNE